MGVSGPMDRIRSPSSPIGNHRPEGLFLRGVINPTKAKMIDQFLPAIDEVRADGAVVLLKWDGERSANRCTVVITKVELDYVWRQDSDDMAQSLRTALADYNAARGIIASGPDWPRANIQTARKMASTAKGK